METVTVAHVLLTALVAVATVVVSLFTAVLAKIWNEIKTLRDVRSDDRDMISKVDSKLQVIENNLGNLSRRFDEFRNDSDRRFNAHKTLLQELAGREMRNDD